MERDSKATVGVILIVLCIFIAICLSFGENILPAGYDLALDGYVISRTLMIIFSLSLLTIAGYSLIKNSKEK